MEEKIIEIRALSQDGRGVGRLDGQVCFVEGAFPGEVVRARILRKKRNLLEARAATIVRSSPARCQPICTETRCGGCPLRALNYQAQLEAKRQIVVEQLLRIGKLAAVNVFPMVGMEDPIGYRNRVRLVWDGENLVFRARHSHERGGWIGACRIAAERLVTLALTVEDCLRRGLIRIERATEVLLRFGEQGYVGFSGRREAWVSREAAVRLEHAGAASIDAGDRQRRRHSSAGEYLPETEYRILRMRFTVPGASFFQTNTLMAERLFAAVLAEFGRSEGGTIIDLYGGVGAPGLLLAREGWRVISVERDPLAVQAARYNAARAGVEYEACQGDAALLLPALFTRYPDASLLVDPPRAGLGRQIFAALNQHAPKRIVMISCDPATLARDAGFFVNQAGYRLDSVRPYDMFPWTNHIETVCVLVKP